MARLPWVVIAHEARHRHSPKPDRIAAKQAGIQGRSAFKLNYLTNICWNGNKNVHTSAVGWRMYDMVMSSGHHEVFEFQQGPQTWPLISI